ncbi:hypothetical protein GCM10028789_21090 [Sinomonas halotolerans]
MRTVLSALSVLLAVVLTAAAVPALWAEKTLVDESGFVRLLAPMGQDAEVVSALGTSVAASALGSARIPAPLEPAAQRAAAALVEGLAEDEQFPAAWEATLRESHALNFGPDSAALTGIALELRPLAGLVLDRLGEGVGADLGDAPSVVVEAGSTVQRGALGFVQDAARLAGPLAAGAVLALVLGLLFARRRGAALAWSGFGFIVVAALLGSATVLAGPVASSEAGGGTAAGVFAGRAAALAADSFLPWTLAVGIAGAVFLILGSVLAARRRRLMARR